MAHNTNDLNKVSIACLNWQAYGSMDGWRLEE